MSKANKIRESFIGVGVIKLASIPISLAVSILLARALGPEGFGRYAFIMALVPLFSLPVAGGLAQLLTREVATFRHGSNWRLYNGALRTAHVWVLLASVTVLALYWCTATYTELIPAGGKWALLPVALLLIPLNGLTAVRNGTIKGLGKPAIAELPGQLLQPATVLLVLGVLLLTDNLGAGAAAVWAQVGAALVTFAVATWLFVRVQPTAAQSAGAEYRVAYWRAALLPFTMLALVSVFNAQIGIVILGLMGTDEQVAAMRIAERGAQFVGLSLVLVNMVIAPHIVYAFRDRDFRRLQMLARRTAKGSFLLALPVALTLVVFGRQLIDLVFGAEYGGIAYLPLVILACGQLVNVCFGPVGNLLSMSGYEKSTLFGMLIALSASGIACIVLVPVYGAVGAAFGATLGLIASNLFLVFRVRHLIFVQNRT